MFRKIRTKLVVLTSMLLLLPILVLGIFSYLSAKDALDEKGEVILKNGVRQVMQLIDVQKAQVARGEITEEEAMEYVRVLLLGEKMQMGYGPFVETLTWGQWVSHRLYQ